MLLAIEIILGIALVYAVLAIAVYILQPHLIYRPDSERVDPQDIGLNQAEEIVLDTPDGKKVVAWYVPAEPGYPTILYFHGTAGSLANRRDRIHRITRRGYGVFMPSYRGYSGSTGKPSQGWLTCDGMNAYDHLQSLGVSADKIVVYGESLGTGIATPVAVARKCAALVLEAPFTSVVDVAQKRFPFLPVRPFLLDRFESLSVIDRVKAPVLIVHGGKDKVIPIEFGRKLFEAAKAPKDMIVFENAGHTGMFMMGAFTKIREFLECHISIPDSAVTPFKKSAAE